MVDKLNKQQLLDGLFRMDELARQEEVLIELTIYGGAALALAYDLRDTTKDVDVAIHANVQKAREFANVVANENGWPEDWLNDGVKGFLSSNEEAYQIESFSSDGYGLSILVASPKYLFAMKCMAMRVADQEHPGDREDIINLAKMSDIQTTEEAMDIISSFYPDNQISAKVMFGVQEIMENIERAVEVKDSSMSKRSKP